VLLLTFVNINESETFVWGQQNISAWAKNQYVEVKYKGIRLFFHKDSQAVRWDELKRSSEF